jgi:molybdopterin-binding protein
MLSARNQFKGKVKSVSMGDVVTEVIVSVGTIEIVSVISRASVEHLNLKVGDEVTAVIKSTEVLIDKS